MGRGRPKGCRFDKAIIERLYVSEKRPLSEVANILGVSKAQARYYIKVYDIPPRYGYESREKEFLNKLHHIEITSNIREIIDGELLGDGNITCFRNAASFRYGTINLEYTKYLVALLSANGFEFNYMNLIGRQPKNKKQSMVYGFYTKKYAELKDEYLRWYYNSNGRKGIPSDLVITSTVMRHWYIGDGSHKPSDYISFATNWFTLDEVERLKFYIERDTIFKPVIYSYQSGIYRRYYILQIRCNQAKDFLEFIGPSPVDSYKYKWELNR